MGEMQYKKGQNPSFYQVHMLVHVIQAFNRDEQGKKLIQAAFVNSFVSEKWIIFVFLIFIR